MDRPRVARAVRTMLTSGGAVVQVDAPGYRADALLMKTGHDRLRYPPPPDEAMESFELSVDQVVAGRFSNSGTAPHLFGDRVGSFESDLRALLADASAAGRFSVRLPDNILRIWQSA
jgi:hypothetical protein